MALASNGFDSLRRLCTATVGNHGIKLGRSRKLPCAFRTQEAFDRRGEPSVAWAGCPLKADGQCGD